MVATATAATTPQTLAEENFPENNAATMSTGDISKNIATPQMKYGIAMIFAAIAVFGSFRLITVAESSGFALTVTLGSLLGLLAIFLSDRLAILDLKGIKIEMQKVEDARRELTGGGLNV